jgi:hypothetical protein
VVRCGKRPRTGPHARPIERGSAARLYTFGRNSK